MDVYILKGLSKVLQEYGLCAKYYSGVISRHYRMKYVRNTCYRYDSCPETIKIGCIYVPVVGFDDRYVFVAESLPELVNVIVGYYNRRIEKKFFCSFGIRQC